MCYEFLYEALPRATFVYGFYYQFSILPVNKSQHNNVCSAAHVVMSTVSSDILKFRLLKLLLNHPVRLHIAHRRRTTRCKPPGDPSAATKAAEPECVFSILYKGLLVREFHEPGV